MRFDSNLAWQQAAANVRANRDVLFSLAGVFILLPSLAFALLVPQPEPLPGMEPGQIMEMARAFYAESAPWMIPVALLQGTGTLAMLALLTDRNRPTVGEAIRLGTLGLLSYIGAQLLVAFGFGLCGGLLLGIAIATGSTAIITLVALLVFAALILVGIKTSLAPAVIMVEGQRRPLAALRRSWMLTKGNSLRIGLFYLLLLTVFLVVALLVGGIFSALGSIIAGAEGARTIEAVASSSLGAIVTLYFVAIVAAIHQQLAGGNPDRISSLFE